MTKRSRTSRTNINDVPMRTGLNDDVDAYTNPRKKTTNLKRFVQGSNTKNFDIPIVTFDKMR